MARTLGIDYSRALRSAYSEVEESVDYVMYWWHQSALALASETTSRFGLITTNSISQSFNQRILKHHLNSTDKISLLRVIPDHPWVDSADGAAVRIAMTVASKGSSIGTLSSVRFESPNENGEMTIVTHDEKGIINARLSLLDKLDRIVALKSNSQLCGQGMKLVGEGFIISRAIDESPINPVTERPVIREYISPRDVLAGKTGRKVVDFFGLTENDAKSIHPEAFQVLLDFVKPVRMQNRRPSIREIWWRFAWERPQLRAAISGLANYLVTLETSKHRFLFALVPTTSGMVLCFRSQLTIRSV